MYKYLLGLLFLVGCGGAPLNCPADDMCDCSPKSCENPKYPARPHIPIRGPRQ